MHWKVPVVQETEPDLEMQHNMAAINVHTARGSLKGDDGYTQIHRSQLLSFKELGEVASVVQDSVIENKVAL